MWDNYPLGQTNTRLLHITTFGEFHIVGLYCIVKEIIDDDDFLHIPGIQDCPLAIVSIGVGLIAIVRSYLYILRNVPRNKFTIQYIGVPKILQWRGFARWGPGLKFFTKNSEVPQWDPGAKPR